MILRVVNNAIPPATETCENEIPPASAAWCFTFNLEVLRFSSLWIPPTLVAWYFSFDLGRKQQRFLDTTDFSRVGFSFYLTLNRRRRLNLNLHTTQVGGIQKDKNPPLG